MNVMKFFQGISRFLAAYTSPVIVGVAAITFVYPELFRWVFIFFERKVAGRVKLRHIPAALALPLFYTMLHIVR